MHSVFTLGLSYFLITALLHCWSVTCAAKGNREAITKQGKVEKSLGAQLDKSCGLINDPLWNKTWHIKNGCGHSGRLLPSMNIIEAWEMGFTGKGVNVVNLDSGIEHTHDDLFRNYDRTLSYDFVDNDTNPWVNSELVSHGTSMAGLIGAVGNNSKCSVGVAYDVNLGHIRVLSKDGLVGGNMESQAIAYARDRIDIYVFGYGFVGLGYNGLNESSKAAIESGAEEGRGGLGNIYAVPGGNEGATQKTCALDELVNLMQTIAINAVGRTGSRPYYGEACAAVMASAFSSGSYPDPFMVTTSVNNSCSTKFSGTSSSVAVAGGVLALVIQANPKLTWRDVQHLIALTSTKMGDKGGWIKNAARRHFSPAYGFGLLNGQALVAAALEWENVGPQMSCRGGGATYDNGILRLGPGEEEARSIEISLVACQIWTLEHVYLAINLTASHKRGDVGMRLTSPSKTSVDLLVKNPYDISREGFKDHSLLSLATWGENPVGTWTVHLKHLGTRGRIELTGARLLVFGIAGRPKKK